MTPTQSQFFQTLKGLLDEGHSPTLRELAAASGRSVTATFVLLEKLEELKLITRDSRSRSITLVKESKAMICGNINMRSRYRNRDIVNDFCVSAYEHLLCKNQFLLVMRGFGDCMRDGDLFVCSRSQVAVPQTSLYIVRRDHRGGSGDFYLAEKQENLFSVPRSQGVLFREGTIFASVLFLLRDFKNLKAPLGETRTNVLPQITKSS